MKSIILATNQNFSFVQVIEMNFCQEIENVTELRFLSEDALNEFLEIMD